MKHHLIKKRLQRNPAALGLSISAILLVALLMHVYILDRFTVILKDENLLKEFQTAIVNVLLAGYLVGAYYAVLGSTRNTIDELENTWRTETDALSVGYAGKTGKRRLFIIGLVGVLLAAILNYLTIGSPWNWSIREPEIWWNHILGLFVGWWFAWFSIAVSDSTTYISKLTARIDSVDLLDQSPWSPLVKHGLLMALLTIGAVSISSLFLIDPKEWAGVIVVFGVCLPLAMVTFLLPVRGVHQRLSESKKLEIEWTRKRIRKSRSLLNNSAPDVLPGQMADLTAYLKLIEGVSVWPFQTPTVVRLLLYLLMPIATWIGNQIIETALEQLFK